MVSFHPEKALFPLGCVLRVFPPAAYSHVRLGENPCAAPAQSPGSSTCLDNKSLISELETQLLPLYLKDYFRMGTS
jgi:hypothetical protein